MTMLDRRTFVGAMIALGVIGYGYWGPHWVRNFAEAPGARIAAVSDVRRERLALAEARYPGIWTTTDYRKLLADPHIDGIVIATPVGSHFEIALEALYAGKRAGRNRLVVAAESDVLAQSPPADHAGEPART